jgi:hypothetical protein
MARMNIPFQEGRLFFLGCNISIGRGIKQLNENAKWKSV